MIRIQLTISMIPLSLSSWKNPRLIMNFDILGKGLYSEVYRLKGDY